MSRINQSNAIPRRARIYFGLAFAAILTALWLWHTRAHEIDITAAAQRADRLLAVYVRDSREPPSHFMAAGTIGYPDGWEFAWRYRPCPDIAALKVFIGKSGSAHYSALPDCMPRRDFTVKPIAI